MIEILLPIKPLSVNDAWQGRRFKSPAYRQYETDIAKILPRAKQPLTGWVNLFYEVGLPSKSFKLSDTANFEKPLVDILVKAGYIEDDCKIIEITGRKVCKTDFYVKVWIKSAL